MKLKALTLALASSIAMTSPANAATEIQWWHAFTGRLGDLLAEQVTKFNASQSDYVVVGTHKGNYSETLNAGIAAFRAGEQPNILMVFEVGTATMMAAKGAVKPVLKSWQMRAPRLTPTPIWARSKAITPTLPVKCFRCLTTRPRRCCM